MRVLFFLVLFVSQSVWAANISSSFNGSRFTALTQPSTIFEYDYTFDHSRNLLDISGSNYATYSEDFTNWTQSNLTVSANTARSPLTNLATVDTLVEATDVGQQHGVYQSVSLVSGASYTFSVYFKKINRSWISLYVATDAFQTFCDGETGVTGTTSASTIAKNQAFGSDWYRCSLQFTATATAARDIYVYIAEQDNDTTFDGIGQNSVYLWGAQLAKNDEWRIGPGIYHMTGAANKPLFDVVPDDAMYTLLANSQFQSDSGKVIPTNNIYNYPWFEHATHDALNIFDSDFTITAVVKVVEEGVYFDTIFSRSDRDTQQAGVKFWMNFGLGMEFLLTMFNAVTSVEPYGTVYVADTNFGYNTSHVVQVVRESNIAIVYVDGVPGTPVDVTGYGVDGAVPLYIGNDKYNDEFESDIVYLRVDATALNQVKLEEQRNVIRGALLGRGSCSRYSPSGDRIFYGLGDSTLVSANTNVPRTGGDVGGVLIETEATQLAPYTDVFTPVWQYGFTTRFTASELNPTGIEDWVARVVETADGAPQEHYLYDDDVTAPGTYYTFSLYIKKYAGGRNWVWLADYYTFPAAKGAFFNIDQGYIGAADGDVTPHLEILQNGWMRIGVTTASTAMDFWTLASADDTPSITYQGDGRNLFYIWGAQREAGYVPTSHAENIWGAGSPITRPADDLTAPPWQLTQNMSQGNPVLSMRFTSDVCDAAPCNQYTSEVGSYTFTVDGGTIHKHDYSYGDYFIFNGDDAYLSLAHGGASTLYPSGDFSIVAVVAPATVAGTYTIMSTFGFGGTGGYWLYILNDSVNLYTETALGNSTCTKAAALSAGRPSLITASFTRGAGVTDSVCNLYVDGLSVGTNAAMRYPGARDGGVAVGATVAFDNLFAGNIYYLGYHNSALAQAQHNANYAAWKQADTLPLTLGTNYEHKKLYIDFESKCEWSSAANMGASAREILSISGNAGTADSDTNYVRVYANTDGKFYASVYPDGENTERFMSTAVHTDWNKWHAHKIMWDFSDLTRSRFTTEGVFATLDATMTGAKDIDFADTLIRLGQNYAGTVSANCRIRNLRIRSTP